MKTEHLLIIRFSALGDVAMTVPVVSALARQYPDLRITVLSRSFMRPLFEDIAPNVGFMGADLKKEYHGIRGLNALYRRLVAKNFFCSFRSVRIVEMTPFESSITMFSFCAPMAM